ncbi:MAG: hypothetical protein K2N15_03635 [Lachnospiraceae bacterium]|nr:hypothetical protein [Lachnospiraceae bacterium]
MKQRIINAVGCVVAKWILSNTADGLRVKRKGSAKQIIKVFSVQAYDNVIRPAIRRTVEGPFKAGDVVTDNGYYGEIVITRIDNGFIYGYGIKDGAIFSRLDVRNFKRVVGHVDLKIG